jgi:CHAT domain-containing protein/tetratricopeptide (TPR) repeat protein
MLAGDYALADSRISQLRKNLPASCVDCAEKVRLLEAEILRQQSHNKDLIVLLSKEPPSISTDARIKEKNYRSLAHAYLGQAQLASQELHDAEQLVEASHSNLQGEVLQTSGIIATRRGLYADAEKSFTESLRLARTLHDKELEAGDLLDFGYLALEQEHYGEALDWFNASSQVAQSMGARALLETDLGDTGWMYYKLGDYEVALQKTIEAEEQGKRPGARSALMIYWLKQASVCRQQLGDTNGAEADYLQALNQAQPTGNKKLISEIHRGLSLVYLQEGRLDSAKLEADEAHATAVTSGDTHTELDATLLQGLIAEKRGDTADALRTFTHAYKDSADLPSIRWKIENSIATLRAKGPRPGQAEPWFRKSIATFEAQRNSVKREELKLPFFANGDELYRDYADFLIASKRQDEALHLLDFGRAKSLAEGLEQADTPDQPMPQPVFDPRSVARNEKATILFYSLGVDKSWLWATDARRTQLFILPKRSEIESRINAYQKAILRSEDPLREQNADALQLYDALVAPAASLLAQGSKVIIIPDGGLNHLNFETLLVPGNTITGNAGPHYWIQDVTITNANSIRLLPRSRPRGESGGAEKTLLLIGNPATGGTEFDRLPHAAAEVDAIEKQFSEKDRRVFTQNAATPSAYPASNPGQFSYIHFVAHGTASRLSPLDSAIVLSPSPEHPDRYKLYARDIVHQGIHADLVTISACKGSGVRAYAGEGLVGLSWAFLRAGSHNVIGALWNVDDAATPQLMDQLYRELRRGDGPDTALRDAKLSLIHSGGVYRKPLYWAAFQLYAGS